MHRRKVLLVDDSSEFLLSFVKFLESYDTLRVIGVALSGMEAVEKVRVLKPDIILMDIAMPGMNGLDTTRMIKRIEPTAVVFLITIHNNNEYKHAAMEAGADAFIPKTELGEHLLMYIDSYFEKSISNDTNTYSNGLI